MTVWSERWWTAPEPGIASRLGLYRIAYALFYLWHLSWVDSGAFARLPSGVWEPAGLFALGDTRPGADLAAAAEALLVGALVLLAFGLRTRTATVAVLALGLLVEGHQQCFGKVEHGGVFLAFYVPLFMAFGTWGDSWSLDRARRGAAPPTADDALRTVWPVRALQVVLAALFLSAVAAKLAGDWPTDHTVVPSLLLGRNVELVRQGLPTTGALVAVAERPGLAATAAASIVLFELAGVAFLLAPWVRDLYAAAALCFHGLNALLLGVTFTPIAVVYGLFVDWPRIATRVGLPRPGGTTSTPASRGPVAGVALLAVAVAAAWNSPVPLRDAMNLGGTLDWRAIWYGLLPGAFLWLVKNVLSVVRRTW